MNQMSLFDGKKPKGHDLKDAGIVVINDGGDPNLFGAFVWWTLSGDLSVAKFTTAWMEAPALPFSLPKPPGLGTALRRAVHDREQVRFFASSLPDNRDGFAFVREKPDAVKVLDHEVELQVWLDDEKLQFTPDDHPLCKEVQAGFDRYKDTIAADDVRHWLTSQVIPKVAAVKLRDTGGVYFVPQTNIREFRTVVAIIRASSSHKIFAAPAQRSEDAVEGILDSVASEAEGEIKKIRREFETGELGARGLKSLAEKCDGFERKVSRYEALLDQKQDELKQRLRSLRASLVEASIKLEEP